MSFPNATAFDAYKTNGYSYNNTVGADRTDEGGNGYYATNEVAKATKGVITSSGQPGFESNKQRLYRIKTRNHQMLRLKITISLLYRYRPFRYRKNG